MTNAADLREHDARGLNFVLSVVQRERSDDYAEFCRRRGANLVYSYLCEGTAQKKMLSLWGLEKKARQVICCLCGSDTANGIMDGLVSEMRIDAPNEGVAVMLPVESIAGASNAEYVPGAGLNEDFRKRVDDMRYSLVVTIAEKGCVDMVMDAAREAGARGGTVIHAKGTAGRMAKFFGLTIAEEKEMIYIVVSKDSEESIVRAIIDKAGPETDAKAIAFALPVERIAGFSKL
ncbi:P-II family nitrogen regulator [Cloacibacillus sp. An23]|uniref:P-II family nitrogen regulator n=1 Tax=Cloacibacillus sp. An23 TaxID=1965591 RepID=UPI000B365DA9|nr:P-II family nitrogen regulator [Cloacibacillus sp. An23]OUO91939.1 hypothetical protein B5F39_12500 [Cloacibacillus sp. An23]